MLRRERVAAVRAFAIDDRAFVLAPAMRVQRRIAVRAQEAEVLEAIVVPHAVDVVENQPHAHAAPHLALPTHLAPKLLEARFDEPALQPLALVSGSLHEDLVERDRFAPRRTRPAPVEVVRRDAPQREVLLQRRVIAPAGCTPSRTSASKCD